MCFQSRLGSVLSAIEIKNRGIVDERVKRFAQCIAGTIHQCFRLSRIFKIGRAQNGLASRHHDLVTQRLCLIQGMAIVDGNRIAIRSRSEEHTSELQSLMRISYAVFCLKKKKKTKQ